jgi:hypothetical protein
VESPILGSGFFDSRAHSIVQKSHISFFCDLFGTAQPFPLRFNRFRNKQDSYRIRVRLTLSTKPISGPPKISTTVPWSFAVPLTQFSDSVACVRQAHFNAAESHNPTRQERPAVVCVVCTQERRRVMLVVAELTRGQAEGSRLRR